RAYLPQHDLPGTVHGTSDLDEALAGADGVVIAIPAQSLRATLQARPALPDVPILPLTKGIQRGTDARISPLTAEAGRAAPGLVSVLSSPDRSAEIAERRPCASVVAAPSQELADALAAWCRAPYLRAYTSTDVIGVEVAGAVKNVIA